MSNPIIASYTTTGPKTPIALDWRVTQFQASYVVEIPGGTTASVTFDQTLDDVNNPAITPLWVASSAITATTGVVALSSPAQFCRLTIGSISGGPVILHLLQTSGVS